MNNNVVHIKFDYNEAINPKRDILKIQKALIMSKAKLEEFVSLRVNELNLKTKSHRKFKELLAQIKKIQKNMPEVNIQNIPKEKNIGEEEIKKRKHDNSIEQQLLEIQRKLDSLQG